MNCEKCRIKVMKTVASTEGIDSCSCFCSLVPSFVDVQICRKKFIGVESVSVEGKDNDQLVVIGDHVDAITLTSKLRKKVGCAELVNVNEVKKPTADKPKSVNPAVPEKPKVDNPVTLITGCPPAHFIVYEGVRLCECESNVDPCSIL